MIFVLLFWGILFCIGYLVGGMTTAVVCLLWGLGISFAFTVFNPVAAFIVIILFAIGMLLGGVKIALICLLVGFAAYVFLKLLG